MRVKLTLASLAAVLLFTFGAAAAAEPAPAVKRTVLLKRELRAPGYEAVMAHVVIPVGGREGRHTHPAEAIAYLIEGTISLEVEGKPTVTLKAGEPFTIDAGKVHEGINIGSTPATLVAVFVTEKGKPLTTPAK